MRNSEFNENGPRQSRGHHTHPQRGAFGEGHNRGGFGAGFGAGFGFGPGSGPMGPFGGPGRRGRGRARRGDVRQAVLALLAEEPLNGYQMIQQLAERTEGGWKPSPGAIYPALAQLEDEGLIEQFDNEGNKSYRLTEAGRSAAAEIGQKPWETFNADNAPAHPEALKALWGEFRGLAMAAQELTRNGSQAQQERAGQVLAETKRKLYGLLAEGDVHNGDDLR